MKPFHHHIRNRGLVRRQWNYYRRCGAAALVCGLASVQGQVAFTRITDGPPGNEGSSSLAAAWGDYTGDGKPDLFVASFATSSFLYRNNGGGTFTKVTTEPVVTEVQGSTGAGWADFNNDGRLDLILVNPSRDHVLYRGTEQGGFERAATFRNTTFSYTGAWGDYDQDGFVDLFLAWAGGTSQLWHNERDGSFRKVESGVMASITGAALSGSWGDYDGDGRIDLVVSRGGMQPCLLYHNEGGGAFTQVTAGALTAKPGEFQSATWGDYDGDGSFDLFAADRAGHNSLYRNTAGGGFTEVTAAAGLATPATSNGSAWGDYDNDGWLDLFVANGTSPEKNFLYHNNGDGTFTRIMQGGIANDVFASIGCAWCDYDDDGDQDLFVTSYGGGSNALYRNDGTPNAWLKVAVTGTASNRSGIGARVWVKATISGVSRWQVRQITGNASWAGQDLVAHFGLGNATGVEAVRVEWPSGNLSELGPQAARQTLAIVEPPLPAIRFQPPGGEFVGSVAVTLHNTLPAGSIHYTADGSEPTLDSAPYTKPVLLNTTATLRARVFFNGFPISEILAASYTRTADLVFHPEVRLFTNVVDVAIENRAAAGVARYTIDGTTPTAQSPAYSTPIRLTAATTIKAQLWLEGFAVSTVYEALYQRVYTADDGIPDAWQEQYFGPNYMTDPRAAAGADPDNDGSNNAQEYGGGTNPVDPLSGFVVSVRGVPLISWPSVVGQKYRILRTPVLTNPTWSTVVDNYVATNTPSKYVDVEAEGIQFYTIQVLP